MSQGFSDAWRTVRLYAPTAPLFLAREWVNVAYKQLLQRRRWGFMRGELALTIQASRSFTVGVTSGSTSVTSAALFVAGDAGRQFQVGTFPSYTVQTFTNTSAIVLDRAYGDATNGSATGTILDAYATMPTDFASFRLIADPYNQRRLAFWISQDQLNLMDPTRQCGDSGPRCLAARSPSTYTPTLGQAQYEYWPRPSSARSYPALYNKQGDKLTDGDLFVGVLADGYEVVVAGALAQAAGWPGTAEQRNPYFDAQLARAKSGEFADGVQMLSLRDDEQYPDDLATVHWERWPLADLAYNDLALRASDATVSDLY